MGFDVSEVRTDGGGGGGSCGGGEKCGGDETTTETKKIDSERPTPRGGSGEFFPGNACADAFFYEARGGQR